MEATKVMSERYIVYAAEPKYNRDFEPIPLTSEFDICVELSKEESLETVLRFDSKEEEVKQFRIALNDGKVLVLYIAVCHEAKAVSIEGAEVTEA